MWLNSALFLRVYYFRWQLCAGARMRGCAQAAVETTLEIVARSDACYPHFPQAPLRKKFLETFWGYRLSFVSSREKSVPRYLKSPPDLPKVPTPGGWYCTLYLKSPPGTYSMAGLSTGAQGGALRQGVLIARLSHDRRCANKRADRRAGTRRSALAHRHP